MKRDLPAHVYRRNGNMLYFQRRGWKCTRIRSEPGTPEFAEEYARVLRGIEPLPTDKTFKVLIASYRRSTRFEKLATRTKADYDKVLAYIGERMGTLPPAKMQRKDVIRAQEANRNTVRFANYIVQVLSVLFEHAFDQGWIKENPAKGVVLLVTPRGKGREHVPWTDEAVALWRAQAGTLPRLAFELGVGTVQRPADLTRLRWSDYDGTMLKIVQNKGAVVLELPATDMLRAVLDAERARITPHPTRTILAGDTGGRLTYRRLAEIMLAERVRLKTTIHDLHALRYRGVMELTFAGCTDDEIAAYSGHKTQAMIAKYAGRARQIMRARQAKEKRK